MILSLFFLTFYFYFFYPTFSFQIFLNQTKCKTFKNAFIKPKIPLMVIHPHTFCWYLINWGWIPPLDMVEKALASISESGLYAFLHKDVRTSCSDTPSETQVRFLEWLETLWEKKRVVEITPLFTLFYFIMVFYNVQI